MVKHVLLVIALVACVVGSLPGNVSADKTIVGRITAVTDDSLQLRDRGEIVSQTLDSRTRYMKWVTQRPWQQSTQASARDLKVGRLVAVEPRTEEPSVAALVRIATDQR